MIRVRQHFDGPQLDDIPAAVRAELSRLALGRRIRPGQSVAVTVGSRGVANIALITRTIVAGLRDLGAQPFLVPAMGSHGGGTAEGQRKILESYGVTEDYTAAPIRSCLDVVQVATTSDGIPVYFDRLASEADHVVVVNRIKPHTGFAGEIESGLMKMMLIGLGKHVGAATYHKAIVHYSFDRIVRSVAQVVLNRCRIACGLGIVENAYDQTALVAGVAPEEFEPREKELLRLARQWMPRLPFLEADLLIVDRMGKNISGSGMDTNVVGRKRHVVDGAPHPRVTRIFVRDLTPESHGNAAGLGTADFTTTRLVRAMDYRATAINCVTASHPEAAVIPVHFETDREVLDTALETIGLRPPEQARIQRIPDTLHLGEVEVSEPYLPEMAGREDLQTVDSPHPLQFDPHGNLTSF
jgi:hypothetical protein